MNILIFSWRGLGHPNAGGAEIATHEYAKSWVRKGHNVTLFTSHYLGAPRNEYIDNVEIIRRSNQNFGVHLAAIKWYLTEKHLKYDLVIDQFHGIPFFTPLYIRVKKLAFIHEVAKEVWQYNQYPFPLNLFVASIGSKIEPHIFRIYRNIHFMTISKSTRNDLINWGIASKNVTIIYNGVNKPKKYNFKKEKQVTLTYLGVLTKDKGIEKAIEVVSYLQNTLKINLKFWIIGKGNNAYLKLMKKKTEKLKLKNVKFWGYVSENKKFNLLGRSHLLINPSIREGWGLVVIEAAEVGTPTVAFNVSGLRDSIIDNKTGSLSKEYSIESLSDKAYKLINNQNKYSQMCKNAIVWGKKFSWKKSADLSLKLLENIVKEKSLQTHHEI